MQRRFRRVLAAVKENCSVGYAKIVTAGGYSNVNLIVVKATAPNDSPLPEKYIQELLKIFAFSPQSYRSFSLSFSRRFRKTRCWQVELKCLLLLHRLLQSVPENSEFRFELIRSRASGSITLHQPHIQEDEDYASFIRSYARLLDEALISDLFYYTKTPDASSGDVAIGTISSRINEINRVIEISTQMQSLIDRVIDCKPPGRAAQSFAVRLAMKHIIRESFNCYQSLRGDIDSIEESLLQLPYRSCVAAIEIYKKAAVQADRLSELYDWCKLMEMCNLNEFPDIDRIPKSRIQAIEASVGRMWQVTESSSSTTTSRTSKSSTMGSPAWGSEESEEKVGGIGRNVEVRIEWEKFEEKEESSWEDLLEASASFTSGWDPLNWECHGEGGRTKLYDSPLNPFNNHHGLFGRKEIQKNN